MRLVRDVRYRWICVFIGLVTIACAPIWAVEYYVNQDGSPHVYNAYLMGQILKGDPTVQGYVELNSISVPNSSGHWLLVLLLQVVGPFIATKIITTLTFGGVIAAAGWLRWKTVGLDGISTSFLFAAVLAFNWLWLVGFYNFLIGVIVYIFTVGLYYSWRGNVTLARSCILALLTLATYWSHIVPFAMLAGTVGLLALTAESPARRSLLIRTSAAFLPVVPLILIFRSISATGDAFIPHWRSLIEPATLKGWIVQIVSADPFVLLSRRSLPFTSLSSAWLGLLAPLLWILAGIVCFVAASRKELHEKITGRRWVFGAVFGASMLAAAFGPDDFGLTNGSILRERVLLCGLFMLIPLLAFGRSVLWHTAGTCLLLFVFAFQTTVVWEYALHANSSAQEFLTVREHIPEGSSIASVVALNDVPRLHAFPEPQMISYVGIGRNVRIWDNYEIGHYLFPVVAADPGERAFIHELVQATALDMADPREDPAKEIAKLDRCLGKYHENLDVIVTWDIGPDVAAVLSKWFESEPYYQNGRVKLFRHVK